jgi:hypothetical protein
MCVAERVLERAIERNVSQILHDAAGSVRRGSVA